jgi:hypothetical protein
VVLTSSHGVLAALTAICSPPIHSSVGWETQVYELHEIYGISQLTDDAAMASLMPAEKEQSTPNADHAGWDYHGG